MGNRFPVSTAYWCGNCEDEFSGFPAGSRIHSGRPLCLRCTKIGIEEGWGTKSANLPDERLYESERKPGIILIGFMLAIAFIVAIAVSFVFGKDR